MSEFRYGDFRYGDTDERARSPKIIIGPGYTATVPADPAQRLAMAEDIVGGPVIAMSGEEVEPALPRPLFGWPSQVPLFLNGSKHAWETVRSLASQARAIEAREEVEAAKAEAQSAEDAKVERVAKAMAEADGCTWPSEAEYQNTTYRDLARAAIAAMDADQ